MSKRYIGDATARTLASMARDTDGRTADGKRIRAGRPAPRRTGTRAAIVRNATREA